MKTIVYRSMAAVLLCVFALGVAAQGVLKVKVTNIPSAVGKLYAFHDENGNYQLDKEDGIPSEYCAMADVEVSADTKQVEVALKRVLKVRNK